MSKICRTCGVKQPLTDFYTLGKTRKGEVRYMVDCKSCNASDPVKIQQNNERQKVKKLKFAEYREKLSCTDCNIPFTGKPWLCDFHHVDPTTKEHPRGVTELARGYSWGRLMKEVAKCIPLCPNCHRTRHHTEEPLQVAVSTKIKNKM